MATEADNSSEEHFQTGKAGPATTYADANSSRIGALGALSLSMLLSSLGTSIANVALPTLATAFSASFQHVQWIVLAYLLAITTLIVSAGRLGDILGRRRLLLGGLFLFTTASALCGVASSLWELIAARAAQGVGASIMMALTIAFVIDTVPREKTGSAMGLLGTMSALGTTLGPSLGGVLIAGVGWRAVFFINVPLGLVALYLSWRRLRVDHCTVRIPVKRFDILGTLLLGLALAAYALAMTMGRGHFGILNLGLLLAALGSVGCFVLAETKVATPLISLGVFRNPVFSAGLATNALVATVMMATLVVGPFYLSRVFGLNEALVGAVMSIGPIISIVSGVPSGRLVDRMGARVIVIVGLALMMAGSLALSLLPGLLGLAGYIVALFILTPGYQLFQASNNTAAMRDVSVDQRGIMSGMLNLSRNLGLITGASLMGAVFAVASGTSEITQAAPQAVEGGMRMTFAVATGLIALAVAVALASVKRGSIARAGGINPT